MYEGTADLRQGSLLELARRYKRSPEVGCSEPVALVEGCWAVPWLLWLHFLHICTHTYIYRQVYAYIYIYICIYIYVYIYVSHWSLGKGIQVFSISPNEVQ